MAVALIMIPLFAHSDDFIRGDADANGVFHPLVDSISIYLYLIGQVPGGIPCEDAADVNDDGSINIVDVIYLLNFGFQPGNPPPPWPYPDCGLDLTTDSLRCESYPSCP